MAGHPRISFPLSVIAGFNPAIHAMTAQHVSPPKVIAPRGKGMGWPARWPAMTEEGSDPLWVASPRSNHPLEGWSKFAAPQAA
jgi:hypothetical protein